MCKLLKTRVLSIKNKIQFNSLNLDKANYLCVLNFDRLRINV